MTALRQFFFAALGLTLTASAGAWVNDAAPLFPEGWSVVSEVRAAEAADLVVLADGSHAGFREGMLGEVIRGETPVGTVLIAAVAPVRAVALILDLAPGQTLQAGDFVRIQTFRL